LIGYQVRVFWFGYGSSGSGTGSGPNLHLVLNSRTWDLMAETRDLRMIVVLAQKKPPRSGA